MDPDATLRDIREFVDENTRCPLQEEEVDRLTDLIAALDIWLSHGGALPIDWRKTQ